MSAYWLTIESAGPDYSFKYRVVLTDSSGRRKVASSFADTVWGAKVWGRRAARLDAAARRSLKFEIRA